MICDHFHSDIREYTAPAGVLSGTCLQDIGYYVYRRYEDYERRKGRSLNYLPLDGEYLRNMIGDEATRAGTGVYVGAFTKRLSKLLYNEANVKIPSDDLAQIGNMVAESVASAPRYYIDFDDRLNWRPGQYGDGGSCFWSCRNAARGIMQDRGVRAVRFYRSMDPNSGIGRAWVATKDRWQSAILFNAYGPYQKQEMCRVLAHNWGVSYKRITSLTNNRSRSGTIYINSNGFLIAPNEVIQSNYRGSISIDFRWPERRNLQECSFCRTPRQPNHMQRLGGNGSWMCAACRQAHTLQCSECRYHFRRDDHWSYHPDTGRRICYECAVRRHHALFCSECGSLTCNHLAGIRGACLCPSCVEESYITCTGCNRYARFDDGHDNEGTGFKCNLCLHPPRPVQTSGRWTIEDHVLTGMSGIDLFWRSTVNTNATDQPRVMINAQS